MKRVFVGLFVVTALMLVGAVVWGPITRAAPPAPPAVSTCTDVENCLVIRKLKAADDSLQNIIDGVRRVANEGTYMMWSNDITISGIRTVNRQGTTIVQFDVTVPPNFSKCRPGDIPAGSSQVYLNPLLSG